MLLNFIVINVKHSHMLPLWQKGSPLMKTQSVLSNMIIFQKTLHEGYLPLSHNFHILNMYLVTWTIACQVAVGRIVFKINFNKALLLLPQISAVFSKGKSKTAVLL